MAKMPVFSEKQRHIPIRAAACHLCECCSNKIFVVLVRDLKLQISEQTPFRSPHVTRMLRNVLLDITAFSDLQGM